jgi:hypothetical protein
MKKRAAKTKVSPKARRAAKPSAARSAAKTTQAPKTSGAASYMPPPLKGDGWPPFRYPVR